MGDANDGILLSRKHGWNYTATQRNSRQNINRLTDTGNRLVGVKGSEGGR